MRKYFGISALALAAALAVAPASAQLLDLGDAPVVDLGTVELGGDGSVDVDLGGDGSVDVDLNSGSDPSVTVDLDSGGDNNEVSADLPTDGGVIVDLFGDGTGDVVNVDDGLIDLGDAGDQVNIGLPGGSDDSVIVNLFGDGDGTTAMGGNLPGATTINNSSNNSNNSSSNSNSGSTGGTTVINDRATARTAALAAKGKCFTPNDQQIAHLVGSRTYTSGSVSTWRNARAVTLVPVQLCPESRVKVSEVTYNNANMAMLRAGIANTPAIGARLNSANRGTDDVLAVDNKDGQLTVYVY